MPFSPVLLSTATVGMSTLAFAVAAPASAQEHYGQRHYTHTHYTHYGPTITTTPTIARVVRSSFIRKKR